MNYMLDNADNQRVQLGDTCVIYASAKYRYVLKIAADRQVSTKFGHLKATDLIGHLYGTKFNCKLGWIIPLRLTPELWTQILPHRTQILYQADISLIVLKLDIKPGSFVAECGTGSGSLSHALVRACLPNGHLYTFDINEQRVNSAREEFEDHGFKNNVTVTNRNVCADGFLDEMASKIDACILDLPRTWEVIEHAHKVLKNNGSRLCTFSPCIEQVQRNVAKMAEMNFKNIETVECVQKYYYVERDELREWNEEVLDKLVESDKQKLANIESRLADCPSKAEFQDMPAAKKLKANDTCDRMDMATTIGQTHEDVSHANKEHKFDELDRRMKEPNFFFTPNMLPTVEQLSAQPADEWASHSGYLTFACKRLG